MKKNRVITFLLAATVLSMATTASAITLSIGDAHYVGLINDGIPSSLANEAGYINTLITLSPGDGDTQIPLGSGETYNRVGSSLNVSFPSAEALDAFKNDNNNITPSLSGYQYILGKYDAGHAGSLVWFFDGGAPDDVTLPSHFDVANSQYGLSHSSGFNLVPQAPPTPTPDSGATIALMGIALAGLGLLKRRL